ncbi:hypothetical protein SNEBB_010629 [Seison nebaliae]|nr:hypothetical protein SNEBB_010629 [Seison nebaliae]
MDDIAYYCSQQISIPPELPDIIKQFTKAAIRTQPTDLLQWSAAYFRCLAQGKQPPVKDRIEFIANATSDQKDKTTFTFGLMKVLHSQLGFMKDVDVTMIESKWRALSLPKDLFDILMKVGDFRGVIEWNKFIAIACSSLAANIIETMTFVCELLTSDPPGANPRIQWEIWKHIYRYLALEIETDISAEHVDMICKYLYDEWNVRI